MNKCDNCGAELERVIPETKCWHTGCTIDHPTTQLKDALHVIFEGGYGMFYDGSPFNVILCNDCANKIFESLPNLVDKLADSMTF